METTRLSSKGQVIIPQSMREMHQWRPGLEFKVIDTEQGILLIPCLPFKPTSINEVRGCIHYKGAKKSLKDMEEGIAKGAKKHKKILSLFGQIEYDPDYDYQKERGRK